jgi:two-component system, LytTR family, sensor kinase
MKRSVLVMFHLLFWVVSISLVKIILDLLFGLIFMASIAGGKIEANENVALYSFLITNIIGVVLFYSSYFTLNFFIKQPIRFLWLSIVYIVFAFVYIFFLLQEPKPLDFTEVLFLCIPVLYFTGFGFLFRTFVEWINDRKIKAELEKDKIASQLELLKSKINPHFLFNTLNNIDVLIQDEPEKASEFLKKLSEILRFMLYESNADRVLLAKEIEYIRKYVDLQKIRTSNNNFVKFDISGDVSGKYISPMILIHFIENAFKYATNKKIENAVCIGFEIKDRRLLFHCKNHINQTVEKVNEKNGLGSNLIKQRLDLLYKDTYNLSAKEDGNWYIVNLEIQLNEY